MKTKYISIIVISILIYGCSTPYQPKGALGGYSSYQLSDNTYKVVFKGNQHTKAETVFEYLERRCAEITVENEYDYFMVYEDSSYIDEVDFIDSPDIDDKINAQRRDKYLFSQKQAIDTNPRQTLTDQKTKIGRTYNHPFIENKSTNVVGVFKIVLVDKIIENLKDYYQPASEILEKYKTE